MQEIDLDKQCSVRVCAKTQLLNPDVCFYPFPADLVTCRSWVEAAERRDFMEDFEYSGASAFMKRFVCSDHFRSWDFCIEGDIFSGLKENVFPQQQCKNDQEISTVKQELPGKEDGPIKTLERMLPTQEISCPCDNPKSDFKGKCVTCNTRNNEYTLPTLNRKSKAIKAAQCRIEEQRQDRLDKCAEEMKPKHKNAKSTEDVEFRQQADKAVMRKKTETNEHRLRRLKKEAQRASLRRMRESIEEKQIRRLKNCVRSRIKRQCETQEEAAMRRYNDAVRAALRRQMETDEQKEQRRAKDLARAAARRQKESVEQREERLRKDRERVGKKRQFMKVAKHMNSFCLPLVPHQTKRHEISSESVNMQDFSNRTAEYTQL